MSLIKTIFLNKENSILWFILLLLKAGDVELNPGPNTSINSDSDTSSNNTSIPDINFEDIVRNSFSVVHLNVQSIRHKLDIIEAELSNFDILAFSETWLTPSIPNKDLDIFSYSEPFRKDRQDGYGGIALYVKENIPCKLRPDLDVNGLENLWIEVSLLSKKILVGIVYRPPNSGSHVIDLIENNIETALDAGINNVILCGDFNLDYNSNCSRKLKQILELYNCNQLIAEPTHFTENSSSTLDLIITNTADSVHIAGVGENILDTTVRYHCPVFAVFKFQKPKFKSFQRRIWKYEDGNYDELRNKFLNFDWETCKSLNVDEYADNVSNVIFKTAEECIPNKIITVKPNEPLWINSRIKSLIRKRKRCYRKYKKYPTDLNISKYKTLRNDVVKLIKSAKHSYYSNLSNQILNNNTSSKDFWKITKLIMGKKHESIPPIDYNGSLCYDNNVKADLFNQFFQSQSQLDDSSKQVPLIYVPNEKLNDFVITQEEVEDSLKMLNTSKAMGPDNIHPRVLKEASACLAKPLSDLFNYSLEHSVYPSSWKCANVIPIHKKSDRKIVSNYRPVSLLSIVGKVMERIIHKHVYNFLLATNYLTPFQSGFRPGDSTTNQLIFMYNSFLKAVDQGKEVRTVFCDISKAFDRVWHKGLIEKLKGAGITGNLLRWFSNYLNDRKQRVVIAGSISDWLKINAGVPQGSILGPILFLIYINDIVSSISTNINLFADDTSLHIIVGQADLSAELLNNDLKLIHEWAQTWLVSFNPSKTESLLISKKTHPPVHPPLYMNDVMIKTVTEHKHLGITFSNNCNWQSHIDSILAKAWTRVHILRKLKFLLDRKSLEKLYLSFIRPILEYSDIVWDNCTQSQANDIERVQTEMARIVTGCTKLVSNDKLYRECGWEKLSLRRYKHKLIKFFQMFHKLTPEYLQDLVPSSVGSSVEYRLRNSNNIQPIACRTNIYANSFLPSVIHDWNKLPDEIRNNPSLKSFKQFLNKDYKETPKRYYEGSRKSQVLHTRLRTGCSSLRSDLFRKNIIDDPLCSCGQEEDIDHYFFQCTNYTVCRQIMFNEISSVINNIDSDALLYGSNDLSHNDNVKIFQAVQKFIVSSKRFE